MTIGSESSFSNSSKLHPVSFEECSSRYSLNDSGDGISAHLPEIWRTASWRRYASEIVSKFETIEIKIISHHCDDDSMARVEIEGGFCKNREGMHFEAKEAGNAIPRDLWDTYSAFANTDGGTIVLGLREEGGRLKVVGIPDADGKLQNMWNLLNNREFVSSNLLSNNDLRIVDSDGMELIVMDVPRADRTERPVFIHGNPRNAFRRNGEGDYKCTSDEIRAMVADSSRTSSDRTVMSDVPMGDLSKGTISDYRDRFRAMRPDSDWTALDDDQFMRILGAASEVDGIMHPTLAGLLMFGNGYRISLEVDRYCLDYREFSDDDVDWDDRLMSDDGDWSGNLFEFYIQCIRRLKRTLKHRMAVDEDLVRIDDGVMDKVVREALLNAIANADYSVPRGVVVERRPGSISIRNPGTFRLPLERAELEGVSDPRNPTILRMFGLIGFGERAGSGIPRMNALCMSNGTPVPAFREDHRPDSVTVTIAIPGEGAGGGLSESIMDLIERNPAISMTAMSEKLGIDRNVVSRTISRLKADGRLKRVGGTRGHWAVLDGSDVVR